MIRKMLMVLALALPLAAGAQNADEGDDVPPPPPIPPKKGEAEIPPPNVTIRREEGKVVEEYSINGNVYMVRVTPENAPPYVLVDTDGDGNLETRDTEVGPHINPPHWVLFEWN